MYFSLDVQPVDNRYLTACAWVYYKYTKFTAESALFARDYLLHLPAIYQPFSTTWQHLVYILSKNKHGFFN
jgi:hypothetical protein